jgi:outer membrane lipoprotein-sorting protein
MLPGISYTQPGFTPMKNHDQFSRKLTEVTKNTKTIESRFTQEKNLSVISEKIITHGKFFFKQENKLRWEYTDPYRYLLIMNGEKVVIKDDSKVNHFDAGSNKLFSEVNSIMVGSIRGTILEEKTKFRIEFLEKTGFNLVRLSPLSQQLKAYIYQILIYFNKETYTVEKLEMVEPSGDFTKIDFTGLKINTPVADENFSVR